MTIIFNQRVRQLREEAGLTQEQAAKALGISSRNYQRLEADDAIPGYKSMLAIGKYYHVSLDYLVGWTENRDVSL